MQQQQQQQGSRVHLRIQGVPTFITEPDFSRIWQAVQGCVGCRLTREPQGVVGYVDFGSSVLLAQQAKAVWHGWSGWGQPGLSVELEVAGQAQGVKRDRDVYDASQSASGYAIAGGGHGGHQIVIPARGSSISSF